MEPPALPAAALLSRAAELSAHGESFVLLTVVRAERPTSAKPGDRALLTESGEWYGWIGGSCAEPTAKKLAQAALRDGECRLLRLTNAATTECLPGIEVKPMSCFSGGALDIFIEPQLARTQLFVLGRSPVAESVAKLGRAMGYVAHEAAAVQSERAEPWSRPPPAGSMVVIAAHGRGEREALRWALSGRAGYVGLVASRRRSASVIQSAAEWGFEQAHLAGLDCPAGLDIGGCTPEEVALSILSAGVRRLRRREGRAVSSSSASEGAVASPAEPSPPQAPAGASSGGGGCCSAAKARSPASREEPKREAPAQAREVTPVEARSVPLAAGGSARCRLSAVVLAAGLSERMGSDNKLLLEVEGTPLIRRSVKRVASCGFEEVVVVVGHEADRVRAALEGLAVRIVHNPDYAQGQQSSVRAGLSALQKPAEGAMVCLGDQAWLRPRDVHDLWEAFSARAAGFDAVIPRVRGQRGNPVVLARAAVAHALEREVSFACRRFVEESDGRVAFWETQGEGFVADVDAPEDYRRLMESKE